MKLFDAVERKVKLEMLILAGIALALISGVFYLFGINEVADAWLKDAVFLIAFSTTLVIFYALTE